MYIHVYIYTPGRTIQSVHVSKAVYTYLYTIYIYIYIYARMSIRLHEICTCAIFNSEFEVWKRLKILNSWGKVEDSTNTSLGIKLDAMEFSKSAWKTEG